LTQERNGDLFDGRPVDQPAKLKVSKPIRPSFNDPDSFFEDRGGVQPQTKEIMLDRMRPRTVRRIVSETVYEPIPPEELEAVLKQQAAIHQLSTGKDEEARKAAVDTIQQQLTTQFETDLKQREKELAEVEQRVKTLGEQLDKRKAAQADIIKLRLQTLINDANGLGFPDTGFGTAENRPINGRRGQPGGPVLFDGDRHPQFDDRSVIAPTADFFTDPDNVVADPVDSSRRNP